LDNPQHKRIRYQQLEKRKLLRQALKVDLIRIHLLAIISTRMAVKMNIMPKITKIKYMMTNAIMGTETTNNSLMGKQGSLAKPMKTRIFKIQTINSISIMIQ
jgi:hypothetical protein